MCIKSLPARTQLLQPQTPPCRMAAPFPPRAAPSREAVSVFPDPAGVAAALPTIRPLAPYLVESHPGRVLRGGTGSSPAAPPCPPEEVVVGGIEKGEAQLVLGSLQGTTGREAPAPRPTQGRASSAAPNCRKRTSVRAEK